MTTRWQVRSARPDDAAAIDRLGLPTAGATPLALLVAVDPDGDVAAAASLDPSGPPTHPQSPGIRVRVAHAPTAPSCLGALLRSLLDAAPALGVHAVLVQWDPMDIAGLRALEALGFRPTGEMPYFELGGGHVEYVTGYRDATGSVMDLACDLS